MPTAVITHEPEVYRQDAEGVSFFRDLRAAHRGDYDAIQRLSRHQKQYDDATGRESRALSTAAGAGGQFAPPLWVVDQWIANARPGRVSADRLTHQALPEGVSSINLPKVSTGAATATQPTQNTGVQITDMTTSAVTGSIVSIAGKQVVSQQMIDQSGIPFDGVLGADLTADYARQVNVEVLSGTGAGHLPGLLTMAGTNAISYTTASPKVTDGTTPANSLYNAVVKAANAVHTTRYAPATSVTMHPSRWAWILEALDSTNRPLVPGAGSAYNAPAISTVVTAEGSAGVFAGLPVYLDPSIPTNQGAGSNQDSVIVQRGEDTWLYESELRFEDFTATYADSAGVLFRVLGYVALIPRYTGSISVIGGTGLVAPTL